MPALVGGRNVGTDPGGAAGRMRPGRGSGLVGGGRLDGGAGSPARRWCAPCPTQGHPRRAVSRGRVVRTRGPRGAGSNDKNLPGSRAGQDREALGRSRGGLTSKIHLSADSRCRPVSRVTSAGQRGDSLGFKAVLRRVRIRRRGPGRPRIRPGRVLADKAYSSKANRAYLRRRGIRGVIPERADGSATAPGAAPPVAVLRRSTRASTPTATSSNEPSTS